MPFENDNIKMEIVSRSIPPNTRDIHFLNEMTGVAVTYYGKVYRTTDAGVSWTIKYTTPTPAQPLYQILFSDQNVGFVVGGTHNCGGTGCEPPGGLIIRTTDAGNNWTPVFHTSRDFEFVSIAANKKGDLFAIANGTKALIVRSTNAGMNWTTIHSPNSQLQRITFSNSFGFCTGVRGTLSGSISATIIRSSDNGATWVLTSLNALYATDIQFNSGIGFCIAERSIHKTTDNGDNWIRI